MFHSTNSLGSLDPNAEPVRADRIPPTAETQQECLWLVGGWSCALPRDRRPGGILSHHLVQPLPEDELCLKHCQCLKLSLFKNLCKWFYIVLRKCTASLAKLPSGLFLQMPNRKVGSYFLSYEQQIWGTRFRFCMVYCLLCNSFLQMWIFL